MRCFENYIGSHWSYGGIFLLALVCCSVRGQAEEQILTIDKIAEGLSKGEASFTDLRLEYVSQERVHMKNGSHVIHRVEATYAQKNPGPFRYLERKTSRINVDSGDVNVYVDGWACYDGNATNILDRKVRAAGKPNHGYVQFGYDSNQFPLIDIDPYNNIWFHGKRSLSSIIQQNKRSFQVEQKIESVDGIPTIKVVGNFADSKLTMKLWISPERNFLPLKRQVFRTETGTMIAEMVLSDLVHLPNGLWFPQSIRSGSPDPEYALYQEITHISVDPIPEKSFAPDFPAGTDVSDEVLGINYEK